MREVIATIGQEIPIGRCGEHLAAFVRFDISEWVSIYGGGVVQLIHQRNGDSEPYPCVVERIGSTVIWDITNADTAVAGRGRAELQYFVGDAHVKSETYETTVERALGPASDTPPEPHEAWVDNVLEAASRIDGAGMPRGYVEGMAEWKVGHVPGGNEYFVAGRTKTMKNLAIDTDAKPKDLTKTVLQYMPSPFPANGCHVTATCDRLGQYVSSVNSIYGDATVAFTYRVVDPSNPKNSISTSARFIMASTRKKPADKPKRDYNEDIGAEIVEIAQSYVDAAESGREFAYGENFFYLKGRPINNEDGAGKVECDTFAGLVLRGVRYTDSPYADTTPGLEFTYDEMMANCKHSDSKWCEDIRAQIAGEEANNVHGRDLRFACDYAWLAWRNKGSVFSDIAQAKPGDLCFWRNTQKKNYFDNVSHVAIMGYDGDIYEVGDKVNGSVLHKMKLSDRSQPEYFARIYGEYEDTGEDEDDTDEDTNPDKEDGSDDTTPSVQDRLDELEDQLAELLHTPIAITSFTHNIGTKERGETVTEVKLSWVLNKVPVSLTLDGESMPLAESGSKTISGLSITAANANSVKWTLAAKDERDKTATKHSPGFTFLNRVYYGAAAQPDAISDAFIQSLTKTSPTSTRARSITVDGGGNYIWYCLPVSLGTCSFKSSGFEFEVMQPERYSFTNALGYKEDYYVYRSANPINVTMKVEVS